MGTPAPADGPRRALSPFAYAAVMVGHVLLSVVLAWLLLAGAEPSVRNTAAVVFVCSSGVVAYTATHLRPKLPGGTA